MIDEKFIDRVFHSSFWWSILILSYLMLSKLTAAAAGFGVGVAIALTVLRSIDVMVRRYFAPGRLHKVKMVLPIYAIAKYTAIGVILALIVRGGWISLPAFCCGIGVPSAIIFLKTLSYFLSELEFAPFWGGGF